MGWYYWILFGNRRFFIIMETSMTTMLQKIQQEVESIDQKTNVFSPMPGLKTIGLGTKIKNNLKNILISLIIINLLLCAFFIIKKINKPDINTRLSINLLWNHYTGSAIKTSLTALKSGINDNRLFAVSENGGAFGIDGQTGKRIFTFYSDGANLSNPLTINKNFIFVSGDKRIYRMDENGKLLQISYYKMIHNKPKTSFALSLINKDKIPDVIVPCMNGSVYALDGKYFFKLWSNENLDGDFINAPVKVNFNNDKTADLLLTSNSGYLYLINGKNGWVKWDIMFTDKFTIASYKKEVYTFHENGKIRIIDLKTGKIKKEIIDDFRTPARATVITLKKNQDYLMLTTGNGQAFLYRPGNFELIWKYKDHTSNPINSSPSLYDFNCDGIKDIALLTGSGKLAIINGTNGKDLATAFQLNAPASSSPLISDINNDGKIDLVFGCDDGRIYALSINDSDCRISLAK